MAETDNREIYFIKGIEKRFNGAYSKDDENFSP
jgi:hypothetical protein